MKAIAGKEIRVIEPTSDFRKMVESELTVNNPEYARKQKMGKAILPMNLQVKYST